MFEQVDETFKIQFKKANIDLQIVLMLGNNNMKKSLSLKSLVAGILTVSALSVSSVAVANNPPPTVKADAPNRYVVKKGDTLWDISGKFLDKPWRWKEIWAVNKQIRNPNLIYPKDVLILCVIRGQKLVGIDTGEGCAGVEKSMQAPAQPVVQSYAGSIPPIPLSTIEVWLDRSMIVSPADFKATPYVIASKNKNIITGAGDRIYTEGVPLILNERYGVYREGKPYIDPLTKQVIGLEVTQVASGIVKDISGTGVSSIELDKTYGQEVREGDHVFLEVGNQLPVVFYPKPANVSRGGRVVRVLSSISSTGRDGVVAINLGTRHGAEVGDVLSVFQRGVTVQDNFAEVKGRAVRLPSEEIGHIMVFKVFEDISYAYVLDAEYPIGVQDFLMPASN